MYTVNVASWLAKVMSSSKSEGNVVLKSYSSKKQDSIDAFFHEWQSIHQSQANSSNANGNGSDDDVQEQDSEREQGG